MCGAWVCVDVGLCVCVCCACCLCVCVVEEAGMRRRRRKTKGGEGREGGVALPTLFFHSDVEVPDRVCACSPAEKTGLDLPKDHLMYFADGFGSVVVMETSVTADM